MKISSYRHHSGINLLSETSGFVARFDAVCPEELVDVEKILLEIEPSVREEYDFGSIGLGTIPLIECSRHLITRLTSRSTRSTVECRILTEGKDSFQLWFAIDDAQPGMAIAELVCSWINTQLCGERDAARESQLLATVHAWEWEQNMLSLTQQVDELGLPWYRLRLGGNTLLQIGQGVNSKLIVDQNCEAIPLQSDRWMDPPSREALFSVFGMPFIPQYPLASDDSAIDIAERLGFPLLIRCRTAEGKLIRITWLQNRNQFAEFWNITRVERDSGLRVWAQPLGNCLAIRLFVVDHEILLTTNLPNCSENEAPGMGRRSESSEDGTTVSVEPPSQLQRSEELLQAATKMAKEVAKILRLDNLCVDLAHAPSPGGEAEKGWAVISVESDTNLELLDSQGDADTFHRGLIRSWVAKHGIARIPTAAVTGSIGKTTTTRMLAHILISSGMITGHCNSTGVYINDRICAIGDSSSGQGMKILMHNPSIEAVVGEVARGGLIRGGLKIDEVDVAAILNIQDNHIGVDGISSRHDLAQIKGLLALAATKVLVLNADDELVLSLKKHTRARSFYLVTGDNANPHWQEHLEQGGTGFSYSQDPEGKVLGFCDHHKIFEIDNELIGGTYGGLISSRIIAASFAAAMATGMGIEPQVISRGLSSFGSSAWHQDGRFEMVMTSPHQIMLAFADGEIAIRSLVDFCNQFTKNSARRKILLLTALDSRPNDYIARMGKAISGFDTVVCCSTNNYRYRPVGETACLLMDAVRGAATSCDFEGIIADTEEEALKLLPAILRPGDFCMINFFESAYVHNRLAQIFPQS